MYSTLNRNACKIKFWQYYVYILRCKFQKFDCCGSTGSHGFRDLVSNAGYGSVSGNQPYACCQDYKYYQMQSLSSAYCEKKVKC